MLPPTIKTDTISQHTPIKVDATAKSAIPATPVTVTADHTETSHHFIQGKKYLAHVEGRLSNGNFSVLISNKPMQMQLPDTIQPGKTIALVLLSLHPTLKFALHNEHNTRTAENNTVISTAGKFLGALIQTIKKPLLSSLPINTTSITTRPLINSPKFPFFLQQTIGQSGLFYEAHLAKWVNGNSTLNALRQEPQGKLKNVLPAVTSPNTAIPVDARSLQLVQQQLHVLETHHITWYGEVWNGQQIQWDIHENTSRKNDTENLTPTRWKTTLTLTLPDLGKVVATLSLNSKDLQILVDTTDNKTSCMLNMNQTLLKQKMRDKGLTVQSLTVHCNDDPN